MGVGRRVRVLVAILALVACGGTAAPQPSAPGSAAASATPLARAKLTVAYSEIYEGALPMWYAAANGIFARHGLDVDLQYTASATGVAALLSGQVQVFQGGGSEVLSANVQGADLVLVGNLVPIYPYVFMVPADIKTAADLKGKKVGVSAPGSTSDIATRVALPRIGLDPDKDVTIVPVGSSQQRTAALLAGSIQGGLDQPPGYYALLAKGFHVLFDEAALKLPVVNNGVSARKGWLAANRDVVQRYVDSIIESIAAMRNDRAGAAAVIKKELKVDDQQAVDGTYDYAMKLFPSLPYARADQLADSVTVLAKTNAKVKDFDLSTMLDESFVKSAADRGLGK